MFRRGSTRRPLGGHGRTLVSGVVVVLAVMGWFSQSADALSAGPGGTGSGYYVVSGCGAGDYGVDGWTDFDDNSTVMAVYGNGCSDLGGSDQYNGLVANTANTTAGTLANGGKGGWQFVAPSGTALGQVELWYTAQISDSGWGWFVSSSGSGHLTDCTDPVNGNTMTAGGCGQTTNNPTYNLAGQSSVSLYIGCDDTNNCDGVNDTANFMTLTGSEIQLDDSSDPSVAAISGPASGSWNSGSANLTFTTTESDAVGILTQQLVSDGTVVGTWNNSCNWSTPVPCSDPSGVSLSVNGAALGQGCHSVDLVIENTAGLETTTNADEVCVSTTSPQAPTITAGTSASAGAATVSWKDPTNDPAPITTSYYTVNNGPTQTISGNPQTVSLTGLASGNNSVCVWLGDAAGNSNASSPGCVTVAVQAPATSGSGTGAGPGPGTSGSGSGTTTGNGTGPPSTVKALPRTPVLTASRGLDLTSTRPSLTVSVRRGVTGGSLIGLRITLPAGLRYVDVRHHLTSRDKAKLTAHSEWIALVLRKDATEKVTVRRGGIGVSRSLRAKIRRYRAMHKTFTEKVTVRVHTSRKKTYIRHITLRF